ncbi:MAG TPA: hypothetical protein VF142_11575 [Longimicrobium sp.]
MNKHARGLVFCSLWIAFGAGACDNAGPAEPGGSKVLGSSYAAYSGVEGLNYVIAALEAAGPSAETRLVTGTPGAPGATLPELLEELRSARESLAAATLAAADPDEAVVAAYVDPRPAGSSWILRSASPTSSMREIKYTAVTQCLDCSMMDSPKGEMQVRQFYNGTLTFGTTRLFSGQGYSVGEVLTTVTGATQSGYINTHHWVDVWLGSDTHAYSQAAGEV